MHRYFEIESSDRKPYQLTVPDNIQLQELIRLIYEAAAGPSRWNEFLSRFAEAIHAPSALFLIHDLRRGQPELFGSVGIDPVWKEALNAHYGAINPWNRGQHLLQPGVVLVGENILENHELVRTEFYNDFMRPQDWFHSCGAVATKSDSEMSYISALRSQDAGVFTPAELAVLEHLLPHIQGAVRIHHRIAGLETGLNAATEALDRFRTGVIVVNSNGKVILMNRVGEAILQRRDGLTLLTDGVRAARGQETSRLRKAIAAVSLQHGSEVQRPGTVLLISRPSRTRPFEVLVSPLPASSRLGRGGPAAALFITDPEDGAELDSQVMRQLFGLTPAEVRLAMALVKGTSVEEYAQEAAISSNTARTHVKRIYSKTGVRRQSELVRLLLKSSAGI
jgi:DNA-binding CsgD family transcriptional regulator/PAS domain-containing protein